EELDEPPRSALASIGKKCWHRREHVEQLTWSRDECVIAHRARGKDGKREAIWERTLSDAFTVAPGAAASLACQPTFMGWLQLPRLDKKHSHRSWRGCSSNGTQNVDVRPDPLLKSGNPSASRTVVIVFFEAEPSARSRGTEPTRATLIPSHGT